MAVQMSPPSSTAAASEASADIVTPYHNPCPTMFWSTYVCPLSVESQMESLGASAAASVSPSAEDGWRTMPARLRRWQSFGWSR